MLLIVLTGPALGERLPSFSGESGFLVQLKTARPAPPITLLTEHGERVPLARFQGKALLLNIWATWCAPCVREMPALERLQENLGGARFEVVALAIDETGLASVAPFYRKMAIDDLTIYLDPTQQAFYGADEDRSAEAFPLYGLPISFFIDRQGRLVGYLVGAADWNAEDPRAFLRHLMADES